MILLLLLGLLSSNHFIKADSENSGGWWSGATGYLSTWYSSEESPKDNEEEIENSVKLMELFPTLKEQLNSKDENVKKEAEEFIQKMNAEMKEQKRYTNVIWKGVQRLIDMGKVQSHERRSNEKEVNVLLQLIYCVIDFFKHIFGMGTDKGKDKDKEKYDKLADKSKDDHDVGELKNNQLKSMIEAETHEVLQHTVKPPERPVDHELRHVGPFPIEQTPPPSIPDAGRKHESDKFKPNDPEFIEPFAETHEVLQHTVKPSERPVDHELRHIGPFPTEQTPPPSIPDAGRKHESDKFKPDDPEFIEPSAYDSDDEAIRSEKSQRKY